MKVEIEVTIRLHHATNPVYSVELEQRYGITGTEVRNIVRELRREGKPVANSKQGYYWADNIEELRPTIDDLESRAMSMHETVKALKGCFVEENQLELNL